MITESIARDLTDLLSPDKGYVVKKGFLTDGEADRYRLECVHFLKTPKAIYKKIHRYSKHDYVWSEDGKIVPGATTYRIYQSLRCKQLRSHGRNLSKNAVIAR